MSSPSSSTVASATSAVHQRQLQGVVVSASTPFTAIVRVDRRITHPKYGKIYTMSKRYHVHDAKRIVKLGDVIVFEACRPMSRLKRWRYVSHVSSATPTNV